MAGGPGGGRRAGRRAVRVPVVHEPLGVGFFGEARGALIDGAGSHRPNDAVSADAEVAIAQESDLRGSEIDIAFGVGEKHKVIARAVALAKTL